MDPLDSGASHNFLRFQSIAHQTVFLGIPDGSTGKESACNAGDWVRSLGQEDPLEYKVATHSSILAWRIPWTEEPEGLQSLESRRVRHD